MTNEPAECSASPCDRYGLELVEEPTPQDAEPPARAARGSVLAGLRLFDWGLLVALAGVQIAYLYGLATFARWAVRWLLET